MAISPRVMGHAAWVVLVLLCAPGICQTAAAAGWRLSGPHRPPAGETATLALRGPPGQDYRLAVLARERECPRDQLPGDHAQTLDTGGFLSATGADARLLSVPAGRPTICAYNSDTGTIVARKVIRTVPGRDRLSISATPQQNPGARARVSATGYIGRDADPTFATAADQHVGTVLVTTVAPTARCPRTPPDPYAARTGTQGVNAARFSVSASIIDAFAISRAPRLCAYLTARRRNQDGVRTRVAVRTQTRIAASGIEGASTRGDDSDAIIGGVLAWLLIASLIAGIAAVIRFVRPGRGASAKQTSSRPNAECDPDSSEPGGEDASQGYEFVQRRRDEEIGFAIQRAVGATADVFRDRLRIILEQRDGPDWLCVLNRRRRTDMLAKGQVPPAAYSSFEPRAVLNCLAYDPAALQLIGLDAVGAARKLSGLANAAHHPDPDKPLTDGDYQRAWQLYSQITGYAAPFDRYKP